MKKTLTTLLAVLIVTAFTISSGLAAETKFSGFLGGPEVYQKLGPGPKGGAKLRWIKPGTDFKQFNKIMLDSVVFFFADQADYKGIDPQEMKDLADVFNLEIGTALKDQYTIVGEPGPGVLRLRFAITNYKPSRPGVSAFTSVFPVGLGVSVVKKGATGGWSGGGEISAEMMAVDTAGDDIVALAVDEKQAAFTERFSKAGSAKEAFKFWADRLKKSLDSLTK